MRATAYLVLAATLLLWSGNWIVARAVRDDIDPGVATAARIVIVIFILLPFAWRGLGSRLRGFARSLRHQILIRTRRTTRLHRRARCRHKETHIGLNAADGCSVRLIRARAARRLRDIAGAAGEIAGRGLQT